MLINMRNMMLAGSKLSAKSYVQDGLVAMWDGIENAGWGLHDPNATVWKNLVGDTLDLTVNSSAARFTDRCLERTTNNNVPAAIFSGKPECVCIEIVSDRSGLLFNYTLGSHGVVNNVRYAMHDVSGGGYRVGKVNGQHKRVNTDAGYVSGASLLTINYTAMDAYVINSVFVDGEQKNIVDDSSGENGAGDFCIMGRSIYTYNFGATGKIFRVTLYSRALTADEIAANYAVDKARFNLPDA